MKYKRILLFYILFFTGATLAFGFGYLTRFFQDHATPTRFPILEEAYDILKNHAFDDVPEDSKIEYGMIRGMVDVYDDPYTRFVEPIQHELETDQLTGSYGGIGASLEYDPEKYIILHPFPESPAKEAGIEDGDRLIIIDDWEIPPNTPIDQVIAAIRGQVGTIVKIVISRPPRYDSYSFQITRKDIALPSVTWYRDSTEPRLGLVKINLIADTTADEIQSAIEDLTNQGASHFAIDLRGNRGGILSAGVEIAQLFLSNGVIIQEQYRDQDVKTYKVEKPGPLAKIPMVVLVDSDTASAAEIIAGAIKIQNRAQIIGTETFGKHSIQLVFSLKDGSSLHVTAAKWWIPGLNLEFNDSGVEPDILVSTDDSEEDPFIQAAINALFNQPEGHAP